MEIYLARMESKSQLFSEKISNKWNTQFQIFFILMDEDEIIHISSIVSHFQNLLHESIARVHIDIREELTREIPDRETTSWTSIE